MKKYWNRLKYHYFYNLKLEHKLFFSHLMLSVLALCFLFCILYPSFSNILRRKLLNAAESTSEKTILTLESTLGSYDTMTYSLSMLSVTTELCSHAGTDYDYAQIRKDRSTFEKTLYTCIPQQIRNSVSDCEIRVFFQDTFPYFNDDSHFFTYSSVSAESWFLRVMDGYKADRTSYYLLSGEEFDASGSTPSFSIVRVLPDLNYYPSALALIRLDFPESFLSSIIHSDACEGAVTFLSSSETGLLLSSSETDKTSLYASLDSLDTLTNTSSGWKTCTADGIRYYCLSTDIPQYDLVLTTLLPVKNLYSEYYIYRNFTIFMGFLLFLFCLLWSTVLSKTMSRRITGLTLRMKFVKTGELLPLPDSMILGSDEIGELTRTYNYMISLIQEYMKTEYRLGQEAKDAELKILQAQINPHFLYNVLDMIQWFAEEQMLPELKEAVSSLATFYRISLSKGKELIPLSEELKHVRSYIRLQSLRYPDSIHYQEIFDTDLLHIQVPKTILQPLVENAILHGIQESPEKSGHLTIEIKEEHSCVLIRLSDDGVGMPLSLHKILGKAAISDGHSHGYGIYNVYTRLNLLYGADYGLSYCPNVPCGTVAVIRIPVVRS